MRSYEILERWRALDERGRERVGMSYSGFTDSQSRPEYLGAKQTLDAFDEALDREAKRHEDELDRMREAIIESRHTAEMRRASVMEELRRVLFALFIVVIGYVVLLILGVL